MSKAKKPRRLWLSLEPVRLCIGDSEVPPSPGCEHLFAAYRTKKLGREFHGPKAHFMPIVMVDQGDTP